MVVRFSWYSGVKIMIWDFYRFDISFCYFYLLIKSLFCVGKNMFNVR